jgi:hypothetical protein
LERDRQQCLSDSVTVIPAYRDGRFTFARKPADKALAGTRRTP